MAKLVQFPHHSNCNCCGRQASFEELARRPSGYGPLKPSTVHKRPNTHHGTIQPLERRVSQRIGSANQRRKSLQHGSESTQETFAQKAFDVLSGENHHAQEIAVEIAEVVVEKSILQATESRMKGTSRDKESLLEECMSLKEALCDQLYHLQLHRVHHETIDGEQRKMEITIQELEMAHGLQAPRTGDPSQLKARISGLKCRQQEYYNIMTIQQDDIAILKKDTRVSFTKEASIERDVFAWETRRLQKMIRRLRVVYNKVCFENSEVVRLRENISKLQIKVTKMEMNIKNSKSIIEQMKKDIDQAKIDSIEAQKNARNAIIKAGELETHSLVLRNMLLHEKEEAIRIQKQTSTLGEQIRIVKKESSDRALQATLAAQMLALDAKKGEGKGRKLKMGKLKKFDMDDSTSGTPTDLSAVRSSPSSPATPSSQSTINKDFDRIRANYIKAIGKATNTFVETAPGSGSPGTKPSPNLGSPTGDHSDYEQLQDTFQKDVSVAENTFMDMMDELEYGAARPRKDLEAEAKGLREQLEALQKQQMDMINKWLSNLTIELDNKTLKSGEYVLDVTDSKTNVKIASPDKSPEALARKKAEEEARKQKEAEEAARRAAEEEARRQKSIEEEAARQAAEEEARQKRDAEEEARRQKIAEEEAARRAAEEEARQKREADETARRAAEDEARQNREADEMARRAAEDEARQKRDAEDEARRRKTTEEEAARRAADKEARKRREADEEAARKKREVEEEEAARRKREAEGKAPGGDASAAGNKKDEFFTEEMQGTIKENIKEVLSHLEVISSSVQQKASSSSGTEAESSAKKLDAPADQSK